VLTRLDAAKVSHRQWGAWIAALATAAAVAGMIWSGSVSNQPRVRTPSAALATELQIPLPELDSLQPAELNAVLQSMDEPGVEGSTQDTTPDLGELNGDEPENVLDYWEG
jgi:hypothetical protein